MVLAVLKEGAIIKKREDSLFYLEGFVVFERYSAINKSTILP